MSKYIEDIQGRIASNPINETNTKYPFNEKSDDNLYHNDNYPIDTQYMYNHNEPVSDIDTDYYNDYRNKIEELRKRTESTYEALESCLVPVEVPGMSFQPYEFLMTETEDGEVIKEKTKSFTYFFQDHLSPIGIDSKEYVFRTNKVKFIDDRHRRLIYDRNIHLMSLKEDEDNKVTFRDVLYRTFFEYYDNKYFSLIKTKDSSIIDMNTIISNILKNNTLIAYDENDDEIIVKNASHFNLVLQSGQDIDTGIPSTIYNLHNIGWLEASAIFLNGIMIPWTKILISVDRIDTFIIVSKLTDTSISLINDDEEIFLDYVHIPFKVEYITGSVNSDSPIYKKYFPWGTVNKDIIFIIDKNGGIRFESLTDINFKKADLGYNSSVFDRIICIDPNIKYAEFKLGDGTTAMNDIGIEYTKSFREFCNNDYRCKLKRFNFLGFELDRYSEEKNDPSNRGTFKNDDFSVTWHPFNIMDIRFKHLFNNRRVFKVFYNTKVLYDQDNILRIKNHGYLADEYEKYIKDITSNIEIYMNEIYILAKKDIGTYIANTGKMSGYKYHYVTPYECFLLYNVINQLSYNPYTSFNDFKNVNVGAIKTDTSKFKTVINPELTANSEGKCVWVIPIEGNNQRPVINITKVSDNEMVLADVNFNEDNSQIIITMDKGDNNIAARTYKAMIYYADYVRGNNYLISDGTKCKWTISNIDAKNTFIDIYNAKTNQIVLTNIEIANDNTVNIYINSNSNIPADTYIAVLNIAQVDNASYINYNNGGFIAVPIEEESKFFKLVKEKDIYNKDGSIKSDIKEYFENILVNSAASLPDILMPIDNETRTDTKVASNSFYIFEGDTRGKIIPFKKFINEFDLTQEYETKYDVLKLRFELSYLNNMEEGATPVDEFIYYFDNNDKKGPNNVNVYPIMDESCLNNRRTAIDLDALATNIFKTDPANVLDSIKKMNWSADYIISGKTSVKRENIITTLTSEPSLFNYNYKLDPRYYYNYGYYDENNKPHKLVSEWGLRRNLPEMFYFSINKDEYTIDSMHLLDEVFDFTYDFNKSYEENLTQGTNYVIGYDADKLEQSIKRSVVSFTKTGKELKEHLSKNVYSKSCSLGGYKLITFIKNKNQKIVFDNIKISVVIPSSLDNLVGPSQITYTYNDDENNVRNFTTADMKHTSQDNFTVTKTYTSFKDIDKNFTQQYSTVKYNKETEMLEYYNGNELVVTMQIDYLIDESRLQMSRWNISQQDNYVMIFKNRKLYEYYNTIEYTDINFSVYFDRNSVEDNDKFEFVFFLNANNTIMKKMCETDDDIKLTVPSAYYSKENHNIRVDNSGVLMDKGLYETVTEDKNFECAIPCNTSIIDAENVQLLVNVMPTHDEDKWKVTNTDNTAYELDFKMYSYKNGTKIKTNPNNDERYFESILTEDNKLNGLHRVTKQGGGEYILEFDGKVPEKETSDDGPIIINPGTGGGGGGPSSITGIGEMALATKNVNSIKFNGTIEEWYAISKTLPWIRCVSNLKGVACSDGKADIFSNEVQDGSTTEGKVM